MQSLNNIRIVLVEPQHPGNIGAAARAMKAMGLADLALVNPERFPHAEATARASGADDVLAAAQQYASLAEAVANCALVVGTSARLRHLAWEVLDSPAAAARAVSAAARAPVAVVFGRERSGLRNNELDLCQLQLQIPTNADFASLNLAAAVQVVCYELRRAAGDALQPAVAETPADTSQMEGFYSHLEAVLVAGEFLDPEQPKLLMRRLRRLFNRARPDATEVNILRGILKALDPRRRGKEGGQD